MQIKLTTTGRKSGRDRTVTLYGWEDGEDILVVGSWAGRERDPDWAGNLRAEPKASVTKGKETFEVTAHELSGRRASAPGNSSSSDSRCTRRTSERRPVRSRSSP